MEQSQKHENNAMVEACHVYCGQTEPCFSCSRSSVWYSRRSPRNCVEVENGLTYYLPDDSETKLALNVMEEQFTTYGTAEVMVANIT
ncbi:MAG: hypothetical protein ACLU3I_19415 [Acutalibacteraceae bacterium]